MKSPASASELFQFTLIFLGILVLVHESVSDDVTPPPHRGGEIVRGLPCIKRLNQLSCGKSGDQYPQAKIDQFIDDNKALIRRMYGELQEPSSSTKSKQQRVVRTFRQERRFRRDVLEGTLEELLDTFDNDRSNNSLNNRDKRQADYPGPTESKNDKEDVCQSSVELVTPYWASNSNGKIRAIVNNNEFEQAIHQELCG